MPKPVPVEDLIIPPQDQRICGTICMCQMTAVLSSVALVYLTVAVYMPTLKAFKSGISETPVMCTTTRAWHRDSCDWGTCGEWCLSKSSGACIQIYVNLRKNGTTMLFANCTNTVNKTCYGLDHETVKQWRCIADECKNLTGTFNCSKGTCINITDAFECIYKETDTPLKCSGRRGKINCIEIDGLHNCYKGTCEKIKSPYNCDRRCTGIPTFNKNMVLLSGDKVYLSQCQRAFVIGDNVPEEYLNVPIWEEEKGKIAMASCFTISNTSQGMVAEDCINGTLLEKGFLTDFTNFTYLNYLSVTNTDKLDPKGIIAPPELDLLIANESHLYINMEGCVNTLRDECHAFLRDYGKDGTDHNARARFPCFYAESDTGKVVARFDLESTYKHFLVASILPSVLFVISCFMLIFCQRTVEVGDDAKMRFKGCSGKIVSPDKNGSANNLGDGGGGDSVMAL